MLRASGPSPEVFGVPRRRTIQRPREPLPDYHPAFCFDPFTDPDEDPDDERPVRERAMNVTAAVEDTIAFLSWVGWEPSTARGRGRVHHHQVGGVAVAGVGVRGAAP